MEEEGVGAQFLVAYIKINNDCKATKHSTTITLLKILFIVFRRRFQPSHFQNAANLTLTQKNDKNLLEPISFLKNLALKEILFSLGIELETWSNRARDLDYGSSIGSKRFKGWLTRLVACGASLGSFVLILLAATAYYVYSSVEIFLEDYRALKPSRYSYADIKRITNQFEDKLGQGAYGTIYKGESFLLNVLLLSKSSIVQRGMGKVLENLNTVMDNVEINNPDSGSIDADIRLLQKYMDCALSILCQKLQSSGVSVVEPGSLVQKEILFLIV